MPLSTTAMIADFLPFLSFAYGAGRVKLVALTLLCLLPKRLRTLSKIAISETELRSVCFLTARSAGGASSTGR